MRDPRLDRLADIIVRYSTSVKPGDLVAISSDPIAMPLIEATFEAVLKVGAHPFWVPRSEALADLFMEYATEEQLQYVSPIQQHLVETVDVQIGFFSEVNTKSMTRIDPSRTAMSSSARKPIFKVFMDRAAAGDLRWSGTLFPTQASAQDAEMSLRQYEDFVFKAGCLHLDDPVAHWKQVHEQQQRVCDYLNEKKEVRFRAANGTDLRVGVEGANWINCAGKENFPDGEVFAGPQDVNGIVHYTFPAVYGGREVHGVCLEFKNGRVTHASATKGQDCLLKMLDMDDGARGLGEIAIGTNYSITEFTKNTLFDEKIGGTFHAAVGAGYPESGSTNESGLHWDMVCDMRPGGTIEADGEVFYQDGRFIPDGWPGPRPE